MSATPFRNLSFADRFEKLGDEAEGVFEAVYPQGKVRFGIERPPINLARVPPFVRYTPDFLTAKGLVEVQGFGGDQTFKLKLDKLAALEAWSAHFRVDLFVWDSKQKRYGYIRLPDLTLFLVESWWAGDGRVELRSFPEGKQYWAVHADHLPVKEWVAYEPEAVG